MATKADFRQVHLYFTQWRIWAQIFPFSFSFFEGVRVRRWEFPNETMRQTGVKNCLQHDKVNGYSSKTGGLFLPLKLDSSRFHEHFNSCSDKFCFSIYIHGLCMSANKGFSKSHLGSSGQMGMIYKGNFKMLNTYFIHYRWVWAASWWR